MSRFHATRGIGFSRCTVLVGLILLMSAGQAAAWESLDDGIRRLDRQNQANERLYRDMRQERLQRQQLEEMREQTREMRRQNEILEDRPLGHMFDRRDR